MERRAARHAARDWRRHAPSRSRSHGRWQPRLPVDRLRRIGAGCFARHHLVPPLSVQRLRPRAPLRPVAAIVSRVVRGLPQRHRGGGGAGAPGATARLLHDGARTRLVVGDRGQHLRRAHRRSGEPGAGRAAAALLLVHPAATRRAPCPARPVGAARRDTHRRRIRVGARRQDPEGQCGAHRPWRDAAHPGVGHDARAVQRRRNRSRAGARARASRSSRHLACAGA